MDLILQAQVNILFFKWARHVDQPGPRIWPMLIWPIMDFLGFLYIL